MNVFFLQCSVNIFFTWNANEEDCAVKSFICAVSSIKPFSRGLHSRNAENKILIVYNLPRQLYDAPAWRSESLRNVLWLCNCGCSLLISEARPVPADVEVLGRIHSRQTTDLFSHITNLTFALSLFLFPFPLSRSINVHSSQKLPLDALTLIRVEPAGEFLRGCRTSAVANHEIRITSDTVNNYV